MDTEVKEIRYIKSGEEYRIKKRPPIPPVRRVPLWVLIPLFLLMVLGGYLVFNGLGTETTGQTQYEVSGNIDYEVYLKDNEYYTEKYLGPGLQYIASIINTIRADFDYTLEADAAIDAHYSYEIVATAKATDRNDKNKVLYEKTDTLKTSEITPIENGTIKIDDNVNIDYNKYNEYMRGFRTDFGIAANCFMNLSLIVKVDGAIKTEDVLAMNIPLSDQTMNIDISAEAINREEKVGEANTYLYVKDMPVLIVGSVMAVASLAISIIMIYLYKTRYGDNWYQELEDNISKYYDTDIVDAVSDYTEGDNVKEIGDFVELLDAKRNEGGSIVRYDVDPGYKSYYILSANDGTTTFRYILDREQLDKQRRAGQPKERLK